MLEGMLWKMRAGSPWRDLTSEFGPWESVYTRFSRWSNAGIFQKVFKKLKDVLDCENIVLDSTAVRVHQHGHGAAKKKGSKK